MDAMTRRKPAFVVFLSILSAMVVLALATYAFAWHTMTDRSPGWSVYVLLGLTAARGIAVILMWLRNKAGVVLWIAATLIAMPIYFMAGLKLSPLGFIGIALLVYFARSEWPQMQWRLYSPPVV
jgi:hypothetical protein